MKSWAMIAPTCVIVASTSPRVIVHHFCGIKPAGGAKEVSLDAGEMSDSASDFE
jgi:hypothetical protein